jgi:DNA replication initiation complex subunit (GINS family)
METRDQNIEELDHIPRQHYREILKFIRALKKNTCCF